MGRKKSLIKPVLAARIFISAPRRVGSAILDGFALRVLGIVEHGNLVEILARRNVAQRERFADEVRAGAAQCRTFWMHTLRKPRLKSCVVRVAVLACFNRASVSGARVMDLRAERTAPHYDRAGAASG
jgi:hypothetical protein